MSPKFFFTFKTTEKAQIEKEKGETVGKPTSVDEILYKIEVPANRYDLLCCEGLSRALQIFLEKYKKKLFARQK